MSEKYFYPKQRMISQAENTLQGLYHWLHFQECAENKTAQEFLAYVNDLQVMMLCRLLDRDDLCRLAAGDKSSAEAKIREIVSNLEKEWQDLLSWVRPQARKFLEVLREYMFNDELPWINSLPDDDLAGG